MNSAGGKYFVGQFSSSPGLYVVAEIVQKMDQSVKVKNVLQLFESQGGGRLGLAIRPDPVFCNDHVELDDGIGNATYMTLSAFGIYRYTCNPDEPLIKQYLEKMVQVRTIRSNIILPPQGKIITE